MGAIQQSAADLAELQRIRGLIEQAQVDSAAEEQLRIAQIVADGIEEANALRGQGQLDEALIAIGRILAVDPENADALAAQQSIQSTIAQQQEDRDRQVRRERLIDEGRTALAANRYQEAASLFNRALDLQEAADVRALLDEAQAQLRAEVEAQQSEREQATVVADAMTRARTLRDGGDLVAALAELQTVLALDPQNSEAVQIQEELLVLQRDTERVADQQDQIDRLLADASRFIDDNNYEQALLASNRVLFLDPGNTTALQYIARSYGTIGRNILGKNLPPTFTLFHAEGARVPAGTTVEQIRSPDLLIRGIVYDEAPVQIVLRDGDREISLDTVNSFALPQGGTSTTFTLDQQLTGPFTFKRRRLWETTATATDEDSAVTTLSHSVLYVVPLYRSLWLYSAIAFGAAVAGGYGYARRARRRNELLKRRFNPYVAGAPVLRDKLFFGRERLLSRVLQSIHNNSILLYGERRIGKTSFQHRLKKRLSALEDPEYDFYPVFIDLQGTPQERFFSHIAEDILGELSTTLDGFEPNPAIQEPATYQYRELVRDLKGIVKALAGKNDKKIKLVLLIDEVDELNNYDPRINQRLRSLFMRDFSDQMAAVVSGVAIKKHWESEGSPWYNFFEEIEVKPFREEDAKELIEEPIRGIFTLDNGVVDKIIGITDCKPYLIQKLCVVLVNQLHEEKRRRITIADVEAVGRPTEE
jgi:tetratricopeptide (TPR) repeat protein